MTDSSLHADVGQLLVAGFDGTSLPVAVADALGGGRLGGVILFARNLETPEQVASLNMQVYDAAGDHPLPFVSIDQEGGRVQRLKEPPFARWPPMAVVGARRDPDLTAKVGEAIGDELAEVGFNLDFAPVADVFTNPKNTVIGDRAFGTDVDTVARHAGALMTGLTISGVVPCAKHFPGHGDTALDSHFDLPVIEHGLERLQQVEIEPFRRLVAANVPMIMTAHVLVPALDARWPATLSNAWITGVLRRELKYGGVIVSDDMEMKAVADRWEIEELVERGLMAGVDLFLVCHTRDRWERAFSHLVSLGEKSDAVREQIAMAAGRVRWLKDRWLRPWVAPTDPTAAVYDADRHALAASLFDT